MAQLQPLDPCDSIMLQKTGPPFTLPIVINGVRCEICFKTPKIMSSATAPTQTTEEKVE